MGPADAELGTDARGGFRMVADARAAGGRTLRSVPRGSRGRPVSNILVRTQSRRAGGVFPGRRGSATRAGRGRDSGGERRGRNVGGDRGGSRYGAAVGEGVAHVARRAG